MEYVGTIEAPSDPPGIDRDSWLSLIDRHPLLFPPQPRTAVNPFTQERVIVKAPETVAALVVDGQQIGSFEWTDENLVFVNGEWPAVEQHAVEIASQLGASFIPDRESSD